MITVQKILNTYVKRTFSKCRTSFIRPFKRLGIKDIENMCLSVLRGVGGIRRSLYIYIQDVAARGRAAHLVPKVCVSL